MWASSTVLTMVVFKLFDFDTVMLFWSKLMLLLLRLAIWPVGLMFLFVTQKVQFIFRVVKSLWVQWLYWLFGRKMWRVFMTANSEWHAKITSVNYWLWRENILKTQSIVNNNVFRLFLFIIFVVFAFNDKHINGTFYSGSMGRGIAYEVRSVKI